jgi:YfiH family protein
MDIPLRHFPFHGDGVTAAVTTRHGGVSTGCYDSLNLGDHVGDDHAAVVVNRHRLADALGAAALTIADQQHTDRVALVTAPLAGRGYLGGADAADAFPATDALITSLPGIALTILVADCAPVVLYDPGNQAIGVVHSGRAGTVKGILPTAIKAMTDAFGTAPAQLRVGIGPAIGPASYEIGAREASEVMQAFGDDGTNVLRPTRPGHAAFDLPAALRLQLHAAGVTPANVHDMSVDTRTATDTFFSDRAARPCGRFAAVAMLLA